MLRTSWAVDSGTTACPFQRSTRHASGFALRFPRIKTIRWDKRPVDADRLPRVEEIYQSAANTSRDALSRLESMVAMASLNLPDRALRQQITSAISIVVQVARLSAGTRKVINISEITGQEEDIISMQDVFNFVRKGIGPDGKVIGAFAPSGIRPKFLDRLRIAGIMLPTEIFEQSVEVA